MSGDVITPPSIAKVKRGLARIRKVIESGESEKSWVSKRQLERLQVMERTLKWVAGETSIDPTAFKLSYFFDVDLI